MNLQEIYNAGLIVAAFLLLAFAMVSAISALAAALLGMNQLAGRCFGIAAFCVLIVFAGIFIYWQ